MEKHRTVCTGKWSWGELGLECFPSHSSRSNSRRQNQLGWGDWARYSCWEEAHRWECQHSTQRDSTSRKLELLSNMPEVQPDRSNPQGLIQTPPKSVNIFTWTFNGMEINPWEAGLKPDSEHLAFHIWHCTHFLLVKKELVGIPE